MCRYFPFSEVLFAKWIKNDPDYITGSRLLLLDKNFHFSGTLVEFGLVLEEVGLISRGFFTDHDKLSARLVYFAFQFGVSFTGAFYAPVLYNSPVLAVAAILAINTVGVWHGVSYYIKSLPAKMNQWKKPQAAGKCQCQQSRLRINAPAQ